MVGWVRAQSWPQEIESLLSVWLLLILAKDIYAPEGITVFRDEPRNLSDIVLNIYPLRKTFQRTEF